MDEETEYKFNSREILESLPCGDPYLRRNFIGASDAPAIMGVSPWVTPYKLWQQKCGLIGGQIPNDAMERGNRLEPLARQAFTEITGIGVTPKRFFSDEYDWMMASLDGIDESGKIAVEIKCPHKQYGLVPSNYYPQLQHQMFVCELDSIYYFSYVQGEEPFIELVKRDKEYISLMVMEEIKFWCCIQTLTPPPMGSRDYRKKDDDVWKSLCEEWNLIQQMKSNVLSRESQLKDCIISECNNTPCVGAGVRVQKIVKKGSIDYSKIYELNNVDLEQYRKESSEYWKITEINNSGEDFDE